MNNEEVRLECSPNLVKGHSVVNCAHTPLEQLISYRMVPIRQGFLEQEPRYDFLKRRTVHAVI